VPEKVSSLQEDEITILLSVTVTARKNEIKKGIMIMGEGESISP
jgi:ribosomal protein L23